MVCDGRTAWDGHAAAQPVHFEAPEAVAPGGEAEQASVAWAAAVRVGGGGGEGLPALATQSSCNLGSAVGGVVSLLGGDEVALPEVLLAQKLVQRGERVRIQGEATPDAAQRRPKNNF
eukprot:8970628-Pyramimonas_sp.AAC.1